MWLWIIAVLCLLTIWLGSFLLALLSVTVPLWLKLTLTLAVVLLVVGILGYRRWRAYARAQALERELLKQTEQQIANTRPDRRNEILELQRQMLQGIQSLKKTRLGAKHGARALYVLPWYAIVGPPGAGKTTAIRHSGLQFPFAQGGGNAAVKGIGGTRNCDWWFTNEAILLDTAGRYATEQDDHEEWSAFLDLLKKHRPHKPINGLIVAVSIADLVQASEEQLGELANKLRARLDEIITRLGMVLPVYLMFTKTDLVGGFVEYWGDLRRSERDQVLGATLPLAPARDGDARSRFEEEFQVICDNLKARALSTISKERQLEIRQRTYQFPLEFAALRDSLARFVSQLFLRNNYQEAPVFRGFYFTSGTQEGRPFDRVIAGMARAFGLHPPSGGVVHPEPKSYFVTDLFQKVVFPDQHLATRSDSEVRRQRLMRWGIVAAAVSLSAALVVPSTISYRANRALIATALENAGALRAMDWSVAQRGTGQIARMDPARAQLLQLHEWETKDRPLSVMWGPYQGETILPTLRAAYTRAFDLGVGVPVRQALEAELRTRAATPATSAQEFAPHFDLLKLYLMLGNPERLDVSWAAPRLTQAWVQAAGADADAERALSPNTQYYLELVKRNEVPKWSLDSAVVSRSRTELSRAPQLRDRYKKLIQKANEELSPIRHSHVFEPSLARFVSGTRNVVVEGAYTRDGWARVKVLLGVQRSRLSDESWVLGDAIEQADRDVDKQISELKRLYFDNYEQAWKSFLADVNVRQPQTVEDAMAELSALSEPDWPYARLLRTLHENVALDMSASDGRPSSEGGLLDRAKNAGAALVASAQGTQPSPPPRVVSRVEQAFEPLVAFGIPLGERSGAAPVDPATPSPPTGLSEYVHIISSLNAVLTEMRDAQPKPSAQETAAKFQEAFRATTTLLSAQDAKTRPLLAPLLLNPISGAWQGVVDDAGKATSGLWNATVWEKWSATLAGRYPFARSAKDAKVEDFTEFFRPGTGQLWSFYNEHLQGAIHRSGYGFSSRRQFKSGVAFSNGFLKDCLGRGAAITDAVFPGGVEKPGMRFDINLHSVSADVSEVELEIDGVAKVYRNTPQEWLRAEWPAEGDRRGASVRVRGYRGLDEELVRTGDFGFFRLLDAADKVVKGTAGGRPDGAPVLVAQWTLRSQGTTIKLDIRPERVDAPIAASTPQLTDTSTGSPDPAAPGAKRGSPDDSTLFLGFRCPREIVSG